MAEKHIKDEKQLSLQAEKIVGEINDYIDEVNDSSHNLNEFWQEPRGSIMHMMDNLEMAADLLNQLEDLDDE